MIVPNGNRPYVPIRAPGLYSLTLENEIGCSSSSGDFKVEHSGISLAAQQRPAYTHPIPTSTQVLASTLSATSPANSLNQPQSYANGRQKIWISPEPVVNHINIEGEIRTSGQPIQVDLVISDLQGRSMVEASFSNIQGEFGRKISWKGLASGRYILSLSWEGGHFQKEIIIVAPEEG